MPKRLVTRIVDRRGPETARRHAGLKALLALAIVAFGVAVFLKPASAAIPSVRLAGSLMLAAGFFQVVLALLAHRHDPLADGLGMGIVNAGVGGLFVAAPYLGVTTLSFVLAIAQIVVGLDKLIGAWRDRHAHWLWIAALGGLLLLSGTAIALQWPASGLTAIGRFVGLNLVVEGVSWLAILRRPRAQEGARVTFAPPEQVTEPLNQERP